MPDPEDRRRRDASVEELSEKAAAEDWTLARGPSRRLTSRPDADDGDDDGDADERRRSPPSGIPARTTAAEPGAGGVFASVPDDDDPSTRISRLGRRARSRRRRRRLHRSHRPRPSPATGYSVTGAAATAATGGRRGVSIGVIVALVAVVVVVGTVIVWSFFGDALSHRSHTAAARCRGRQGDGRRRRGPVDRRSPCSSSPKSFNSSAGPVGDHCMVVSVKPAGSDAVLDGFIGKWPAELGGQPALWIPGSSVSAARLAAATGQKTITDSRSLVTSPVLLAVRPELQQALANQSWARAARAANQPELRWRGLNLPAWGSLRLALPSERQQRRLVSGRRGGGGRVGAAGCAGRPRASARCAP